MILKISRLVLLLQLIVSASCLAQNSFGIRAGLNINDIAVKDPPPASPPYNGFPEPKVSLGYHIAVLYKIKITDRFSVIPEAQLVQKGASYDDERASDFRSTYVEANVLASFRVISHVNLSVGPYFGYLVSSTPQVEFWEKNDLGLTGGLTIGVGEHIDIIGRYQHGLSALAEYFSDSPNNSASSITKLYNRNFQIGICYRFKSEESHE